MLLCKHREAYRSSGRHEVPASLDDVLVISRHYCQPLLILTFPVSDLVAPSGDYQHDTRSFQPHYYNRARVLGRTGTVTYWYVTPRYRRSEASLLSVRTSASVRACGSTNAFSCYCKRSTPNAGTVHFVIPSCRYCR